MSKSFGFTGFKLKQPPADQKSSSSSSSNNSKLQKLYPLPSGLKPTGPKINVSVATQKKHRTEEE